MKLNIYYLKTHSWSQIKIPKTTVHWISKKCRRHLVRFFGRYVSKHSLCQSFYYSSIFLPHLRVRTRKLNAFTANRDIQLAENNGSVNMEQLGCDSGGNKQLRVENTGSNILSSELRFVYIKLVNSGIYYVIYELVNILKYLKTIDLCF